MGVRVDAGVHQPPVPDVAVDVVGQRGGRREQQHHAKKNRQADDEDELPSSVGFAQHPPHGDAVG
jgi:hypothetical protein